MGRAIVREPAAFLMDEPLSNLDAKTAGRHARSSARLHDRLGVTTIYVPRSGGGDDARLPGGGVRDGTVQQVDTPQTLYREPDSLFVAAFIGSPSMNLVEARVAGESVEFAGFRIPLAPDRPAGREDDTVILGSGRRTSRRADCRRGAAADRGRCRRRRGARLLRTSSSRRGAAGRRRRSRGGDRRRRARGCSRPTAAPSSRPRLRRRRACARVTGSSSLSTGRSILRSRDRREPARGAVASRSLTAASAATRP